MSKKFPILNSSTNFTVNGKCSKCGGCCSNLLPLTEVEIKHLRKIVRKRKIKPHRNHVMNAKYDMTCPFLNDEHRCVIYEDRPMICRFFRCDKKAATKQEINLLTKAIPVNVRSVIFNEQLAK